MNGLVLIVDDAPENLRLLSNLLKKQGCDIRAVTSAKMALTTARAIKPDLILLDVKMPEMDGYEVCRQIKADPDPRIGNIPILFISMLDALDDKVKGFQVGGVDYITKPFEAEEVLARVETHLTLRRLRDNLEQAVKERTAELSTAYRMLEQQDKSRTSLVSAAAGELRTALAAINGYAEMLSVKLGSGQRDDAAEWLDGIKANVRTMLGIISSVLDASAPKVETASPEEFPAWLSRKIEEREWSLRDMERHANVSRTTIGRVINGEQDPTPEFCEKVACTLNLSETEVMWRAGMIPIKNGTQLLELATLVLSANPDQAR
jgi:DNA-binding response OmpR family regulator/DNA-binding XRE family transcriptional regulator